MSAAPSPALQPPATAAVDPRTTSAPSHGTRALTYGFLIVAAVSLGVLLEGFGPPWVRVLFDLPSIDSPSAIAALWAAALVAVFIHEAGHLLAALFFNFEILGISLGPVRVQRLHGKYAVRFSLKRLFAGSMSAIPTDMEEWRRRSMVVAAAGPAATLWASVAACCVVALNQPGSLWNAFWSALAIINFFIFVLGLIPNGANSSVRNDAALFWLLLRNGPEARDLEVAYLIAQLRMNALRPQDYPETLMDRLATARLSRRPDTNVLVARTMSDWALDFGDVRMADVWDRQAVTHSQNCDPRLRNSALAASACLDILFRDNSTAARDKFNEVDLDELFPPSFAHRVRAVWLLALDQPQDAPAEIIRAQYSLPMGLAYYDFERMLLDKIHARSLAAQ